MNELHSNSLAKKSFGALMLLVTLASILALAWQTISLRLEYDEGYNLQVAESLKNGEGYASFGALRTGDNWKFDPHITTGPLVLLPVAAIWVVTDGSIASIRGLMLFFLLAYIAAWWCLLRGGGAAWGIFGLSVAPALAVLAPASGRVLGELPGAAMLVWAGVALSRQKPALAAFAIGLAIQAKVVYGLAGVAVLAVWLFLSAASGERRTLRGIAVMAALVAAPSVAFEVYRLVSSGSIEGYLESIAEFKRFLASQNANSFVSTWVEPRFIGPKTSAFFSSYPTFAWMALSGAAAGLLCRAVTFGTSPHSEHQIRVLAPRLRALAALLVAGIAMAIGWLTQSSQLGQRQALPFLLLSVPALVAVSLLLSVDYLSRSSDTARVSLLRVAIASAVVVLSLAMLGTLFHSMQRLLEDDMPRAHAAKVEQAKVSEKIRALGATTIFADGWWQNPEYQLLTGVPGIPWRTGRRQLLVVQDYQVALTSSSWTHHLKQCAQVIERTPFILLCWLPDTPPKEAALRVVDWSPRTARVNQPSDPEPGGGSWIRFKLESGLPGDVGPVKVHFGRHSTVTRIERDGSTLFGVAPSALFRTRGEHEVVLEQLSTGQKAQVGTFKVE